MFYCDNGVGFLRSSEGGNPDLFLVPLGKGTPACCPLSDTELYLNPETQKEEILALLEYLGVYAESVWKQARFTHTANYVSALNCIKESYENEPGRVLLFSLLDPRVGPCLVRPRT